MSSALLANIMCMIVRGLGYILGVTMRMNNVGSRLWSAIALRHSILLSNDMFIVQDYALVGCMLGVMRDVESL